MRAAHDSTFLFFFFNDTATTEIYTLSLHDALPIFPCITIQDLLAEYGVPRYMKIDLEGRSEEHTSELQSQSNLVCRLLLEKKKKKNKTCGTVHVDWPVFLTFTAFFSPLVLACILQP